MNKKDILLPTIDSKAIEWMKTNYAKELTSPLNISIEVTNKCNINCIHCYNTRQIDGIQHSSLDKEKIDRIVDQLVENNALAVGITWGEPLMKKREALYIVEKCSENWITTRLNTNLMLLDEETADELKKNQLKSILTSLTSFDKETHDKITGRSGNFQKVIKGIQLALEKNIKVGVNMVLTKINKDHVYETGKFVHNLWAKGFYATKWSRPINIPNFQGYWVNPDDVLRSLEDLIKVKEDFWINVDVLECYPLCLLWENPKYFIFANHKCTAGISTATIWSNWDVRSCNHSNKTYGNILHENLTDIWKKMWERRSGELLPKQCLSCNYISKCTWGCRMEAESKGNIKELDPFAKPENLNNIPQLLLNKQSKPIDLLKSNLQVNLKISFREEKDLSLINVGDGAVAITKDSWQFIKILSERKSFFIEDIAKEFSIDIKELNSFLSNLWKKNFITIL